MKRLTKREAADFHKLLVCGHVLVTVMEAFAVAPPSSPRKSSRYGHRNPTPTVA